MSVKVSQTAQQNPEMDLKRTQQEEEQGCVGYGETALEQTGNSGSHFQTAIDVGAELWLACVPEASVASGQTPDGELGQQEQKVGHFTDEPGEGDGHEHSREKCQPLCHSSFLPVAEGQSFCIERHEQHG